MCTVLLPPGDNPIAVNKYIISYHLQVICPGIINCEKQSRFRINSLQKLIRPVKEQQYCQAVLDN